MYCCIIIFVFCSSTYAHTRDIHLSVDNTLHNDITEENIDEVINSKNFVPLKKINQYVDGNPWLKVEWDKEWNKESATEKKYLINDFQMQAIENYFLVKDNKVIASYTSGNNALFNTRPITHYKFVMDTQQADYALVKVCCDPTVPKYFRLLNKDELKKDYYHNLIKYAVFYSLLCLLVLYNAFIYIYLREKQYLYYCLYISTMILFLLSISGIGKQFLLPNFIYYDAFTVNIALAIPITNTLFIINFLDRNHISRRLLKSSYVVIVANSFLMTIILVTYLFFYDSFYSSIKTYGVLVEIFSLVTIIINDYMITRSLLAKDASAKVMLMGYSLINIGALVFVFRYNGLIKNNNATQFFMEIFAVLDAIILSLGLAQKIQTLRIGKQYAERKQLETQKQFSQKLLQVQEKEKKQLGNTLHDNFTHQLLILKNNVEKKLGNTDEVTDIDRILNEIRDLSHMIHPHVLENLGLNDALAEMIDCTMNTYDLDISLATDSNVVFSKEQNLIIYRIIQESLNNIIKHAKASECVIAITNKEKISEIIIKDDGQGFNVKKAQESDSLGISTIQERCQMLHGCLKITSSNSGTRIIITFPHYIDPEL